MNKSNVWSLSDGGDEAALRKAIKNVPTCVNVAGWSYAGGHRRGLARGTTRTAPAWEATSSTGGGSASTTSFPAPILHFATVAGSMPCVLLALEHGASADTQVDGNTADQMADALGEGWEEIAEVIRATRRKQHDRLGVLTEDETTQRVVLETREKDHYKQLMDSFSRGVVEVEIHLKDPGVSASGTTKYTLTIPRYVSCKTFHKKVEETVGQRVLLSFKTPKSFNPNDIPHKKATTPHNNLKSQSVMSVQSEGTESKTMDPDELAWIAEKDEKERPKFLELKPRTIGIFLQQRKPICIARPLGFQYVPQDVRSPARERARAQTPLERSAGLGSGKNNHSNDSHQEQHHSELSLVYNKDSGLPTKLESIRKDSKLPAEKRIEKLMKVLADEEESLLESQRQAMKRPSSSLAGGGNESSIMSGNRSFGGSRSKKASTPTVISRENLDKVVERLYDRSLTKLKTRKDSYDQFTNESLLQLDRTKKVGELNADQAASVDRLFGGQQSKLDSIAKIEEMVNEAMPKPKALALSEEEVQAMADRLCPKKGQKKGVASSSSLSDTKKQRDPWYQTADKKEVSDMDAHIQSVYYGAVEKKKERIGKIEVEHGDFRTKKRGAGKKMTKDEIKAMGDRLCSKK